MALLVDEILHPPPETASHSRRLLVATAVIFIGAGLGTLSLQARRVEFLVQCAAMAFILLVVIKFTPIRPRARERLIVFAAVLLAAGIISLVAERWRVPAFDEATVTLTDQPDATGYYVTTTDNSVVLIKFTDVDGRELSCPIIEAVPRAKIERIEVGHSRAKLDPAEDCSQRRSEAKTVKDQNPTP
jgi:hypothetical protein